MDKNDEMHWYRAMSESLGGCIETAREDWEFWDWSNTRREYSHQRDVLKTDVVGKALAHISQQHQSERETPISGWRVGVDAGSPLQQQTIQQAESVMYRKLASWLCFFFHGVSRPDIAAEFASAASHVGAYPGGAFYFKMAGDAFRFERRRWAKREFGVRTKAFKSYHKQEDDIPIITWLEELGRKFREGPTHWNKEGILVMAYSPLLVEYSEGCVNGSGRDGDDLIEFKRLVERLALLYAKFQMCQYLTAGYPLRYAISRYSVCQAIYYQVYHELRLDAPLPPEVNTVYQKCDAFVRETLKSRLAKFFGQTVDSRNPRTGHCQEIVMFDERATQRRGLTSCVLSSEDGVSANRPNRVPEEKALSYWVELNLLDTDREKVLRLWREAPTNSKFPLDFGTLSFGGNWLPPSNNKMFRDIRRKIEEEALASSPLEGVVTPIYISTVATPGERFDPYSNG